MLHSKIITAIGLVDFDCPPIRWFPAYWYTRPMSEFKRISFMSDDLEIAFGKVGDLYVRHQNTWDNTAEVDSADEIDNSTDSYDSDEDDVMFDVW